MEIKKQHCQRSSEQGAEYVVPVALLPSWSTKIEEIDFGLSSFFSSFYHR